MVALALLGIPIYLAIFACALIIIIAGQGIDPIQPMLVMSSRLGDIILLAVPMFILIGQFLAYGGAGKPLVKMLNAFFGHIPGGPAYALIFANVAVAAMCAEPIAAVAAFGPLIIPTLVGLGYSERFAVGLVISSASLAPLIPPNIIAILYAYIASPMTPGSVSVQTLWNACIIPGLVIAFLLCVLVFFYSRRGHYQRLPRATWTERWESIREAGPVALTPFAILGPLYAGWASPTEVSAIGVIYVMLISIFIYRGLNLKTFWECCVNTLRILGAIFLIIAAATLLTIAITYARLPQDITGWISDMGLNSWTFMLVMIVTFLIMGMFLDPTAILLVSVPMLLAAVVNLDINIYVFGVFTMIAVNLGNITPPYGLTIFATQSILGKPYSFIVKACMMFYLALFIGMILVAFIPGLSTWLPNLID